MVVTDRDVAFEVFRDWDVDLGKRRPRGARMIDR